MRHLIHKIAVTGTLALGLSLNAIASNFGTEKTYSQMYPPISFLPLTDNADYAIAQREHTCVSGTPGQRVFYAPVHLPTGAKPVSLTAMIKDNQVSNINVKLQRTCNGLNFLFQPDTNLSITDIINLSSSGNSGVRTYFTADASEDHNINNLRCAYTLRLNYPVCHTDNELNRVAIRYKREVTAAPSTAPYTDVPVSHPFAQHINAFKNAGITGGCGGGNFCPDDPVTRGQMAVFLAKAMGLSWNDSNGLAPIIIPPIFP